MAYIGPEPAESFTSFATQEFSTSATTSYTLDHAVANENEIALFVNNVRQQPGSGKAYTATGTALTLSAATASTDTMYCVFLGRALQTVTPATNSINNAMVSSSAAIATSKLGTGAILQVVTVSKTDTASESINANSVGSNITGMSPAITPSSSSNKIFVLVNINIGRSDVDADSAVGVQLLRGTTLIGIGDTASSRTRVSAQTNIIASKAMETISIMHLDSPSTTSETTYNLKFVNSDGDNSTIYLNRSDNDSDSASRGRGASSITLMEVAG
jgi:hypothetical protein